MRSFWLPPGWNSCACELKVVLALGLQGLWGESPCAGSAGGLCCWVSYRRAVENQGGVWPPLQIQVTGGWCVGGTLRDVLWDSGVTIRGNGKGPGMWQSVSHRVSYCLSAENGCCSPLHTLRVLGVWLKQWLETRQ